MSRLIRIIFQRVTEEHCTDFRAAEWKPKMSRLRRLHGVHAQTTRLVCSFRKNFNVQTHARFISGVLWNSKGGNSYSCFLEDRAYE